MSHFTPVDYAKLPEVDISYRNIWQSPPVHGRLNVMFGIFQERDRSENEREELKKQLELEIKELQTNLTRLQKVSMWLCSGLSTCNMDH